MSSTNSPEPTPAAGADPHGVTETATTRKSYRRKYRKIMVIFEEKMRESNTLFKDEQRIFDISLRLAEQTDQLLQMLVDLNSCPQIPKRIRYDLRRPRSKPLYFLHKEQHEETDDKEHEEENHLAMRKARHRLQTGESDPSEYQELINRLSEPSGFPANKTYTQLIKSAPSIPSDYGDEYLNGQSISGFLTAKQKETYLHGLDMFLDGNAATARPHAASSLGNRNAERTTDREREMQLRNPVSVYNWLRKNQPQVFLQDNEAGGDKPTKAPGSRSSKRMANRDSTVKLESDMYDDDGIAVEGGAGMKGKRKRDEDPGYRPKGGTSRPTKRKKDEPGNNAAAPYGRRGKKMSIDAR